MGIPANLRRLPNIIKVRHYTKLILRLLFGISSGITVWSSRNGKMSCIGTGSSTYVVYADVF